MLALLTFDLLVSVGFLVSLLLSHTYMCLIFNTLLSLLSILSVLFWPSAGWHVSRLVGL